MRTNGSIEINKPIDEVFRFTTENVADWSLIVIEDELLEETPDGVGTTFRTVTEDRGRKFEFQGKVTKHSPPHAHSVIMRGSQFDIDVHYAFEDLGGRTRVTQDSTVHPKGFIKILNALLGWMFKGASCRALEKELNNLKRLLETPPS